MVGCREGQSKVWEIHNRIVAINVEGRRRRVCITIYLNVAFGDFSIIMGYCVSWNLEYIEETWLI